LPLSLRELLFLPLQRLPFLYQRAKRRDKCIGHESLHASREMRYLPENSTGTIPLLQAINPPLMRTAAGRGSAVERETSYADIAASIALGNRFSKSMTLTHSGLMLIRSI